MLSTPAVLRQIIALQRLGWHSGPHMLGNSMSETRTDAASSVALFAIVHLPETGHTVATSVVTPKLPPSPHNLF